MKNYSNPYEAPALDIESDKYKDLLAQGSQDSNFLGLIATKDGWTDSKGKKLGLTKQQLENIDKIPKIKEAVDELSNSGGDGGEDGLTPFIGKNGNWWIGTQDTGVKAEGEDGVSVTHSWDGTTLTITSASGTSFANLKGDKGDAFSYNDFTEEQLASLKGNPGANGYTPIKGTDYWTEEDKEEILKDVKTELDFDNKLSGMQEALSDEQLQNINKIPDIEQTATSAAVYAKDAYGIAGSAYDRTLTLESGKQDKVTIYQESSVGLSYDFKFADMYNCEYRIQSALRYISFTFGTDAYPNDYTAGFSFDSSETPTDAIYYTNDDPTVPQLINWVGTDCTLDYYENEEGQLVPVSIFQPSANTHYDIVFFFNGTQMIGLVIGFVPASGNVVSE